MNAFLIWLEKISLAALLTACGVFSLIFFTTGFPK